MLNEEFNEIEEEETMEEPEEDTMEEDTEITEAVSVAIVDGANREDKINLAIEALEALRETEPLGGFGGEGIGLEDLEEEEL